MPAGSSPTGRSSRAPASGSSPPPTRGTGSPGGVLPPGRGERSVAQQATGLVADAVQVLTTGALPLRTARDLIVVTAPEAEIAMLIVVPPFRLALTRVDRLSVEPLLFRVEPEPLSRLGQLGPLQVTETVAPFGRFLTRSWIRRVVLRAIVKRKARTALIGFGATVGPAATTGPPGDGLTAGCAAAPGNTIASKDLVATLPAASVAVHVTVVVPSANCVPDAGVQATTGAGSTVSVAAAS